MTVLIATDRDHANQGYEYMRALQAVGVDCIGVKMVSSAYGYPKQLKVVSVQEMTSLLAKAKKILFPQTNHAFRSRLFRKTPGQYVVICHNGSEYRDQTDKVYPLANQQADVLMIQTPDLWNLKSQNVKEVFVPQCTNVKEKKQEKNDKLHVYHSPSNPRYKGSKAINQMCRNLQEQGVIHYEYATRIKWIQNMESMKHADVYVDQFIDKNDRGNKMGIFGVSALEAASRGCIVFGSFRYEDFYMKHTGIMPQIYSHDTIEDMADDLRILAKYHNGSHMKFNKSATYEWVLKAHSREVIGRKLKTILKA